MMYTLWVEIAILGKNINKINDSWNRFYKTFVSFQILDISPLKTTDGHKFIFALQTKASISRYFKVM
jgi:hypothetical protein